MGDDETKRHDEMTIGMISAFNTLVEQIYGDDPDIDNVMMTLGVALCKGEDRQFFGTTNFCCMDCLRESQEGAVEAFNATRGIRDSEKFSVIVIDLSEFPSRDGDDNGTLH